MRNRAQLYLTSIYESQLEILRSFIEDDRSRDLRWIDQRGWLYDFDYEIGLFCVEFIASPFIVGDLQFIPYIEFRNGVLTSGISQHQIISETARETIEDLISHYRTRRLLDTV